jgi:hypothetical protein
MASYPLREVAAHFLVDITLNAAVIWLWEFA